MADDPVATAAEREYQARLLALHEARAALASASAQLRRARLDRRPATAGADASEAGLGRQIEELTALVAGRRERAEAQRQLLHRLTTTDYEPLEVAEAELEDGRFEQPPFLEPQP